MKTLYRAYRPQNFKEIVNQNHVKITLQNEIESGKMAHAYIFCGPRGIGKTTIARIFAKSLNCEQREKGDSEPCNECDMCKDLMSGRSLDVIEIDAASHTGVDNVRENIISVARVAPSRGKYKIFIIDEVHMLSISAFNALLKLLEEPPANTVFILCTTEVHKIPDTIISRTERFDFKRISASDIVKKLQYICLKEKIKIDTSILENIARQSGGHMRDAESLLGQVVSIGGNEVSVEEADLVIPRSDINEILNLIELLAKKNVVAAIGLVNKLLDDGISLKRFLTETIELLRKIMLAKIDQNLSEKFGLEFGESVELRVTEIGITLELDYIVKIIEKFIAVQNKMKGVFIEQLPLEIAITELCLPDIELAKNSDSNFKAPVAPTAAPIKAPVTSPVSPSIVAKANVESPGPKIDIPQESKPSAPIVSSASSQPFTEAIDITKEQIDAKWNDVLAKVKAQNHSLSFILKACEPKELKGKQLFLAFKYKFHKERIAEVEIKQMIEKVLVEVYGQSIEIETVIDEAMKVDSNQTNTASATTTPKVEDNANNVPIPTEAGVDKSEAASVSSANATDEDMLSNVLKTFGGKVM